MPKALTPVTRDYTIVLHNLCHGIQFKKKAPRALKAIKKFALDNMRTKDVKVDVRLNQFIWSKGIRNVPRRIRVRMIRKRDEEDTTGDKYFTLVQLIKTDTFKGVRTEKNTGTK